ncbi:MAG: tetratricopeptide repeat protein [Alphaproteobacteria bacterium]
MRVGARDGYARVVWGWTQDVGYTLTRETDGDIVILFDKAAKTDTSQIDVSALDYVHSVSVLSQDPLKVSITIPKSSNIRDFNLGKRVILDIYEPEDKNAIQNFKKRVDDKIAQIKAPSKPVAKKEIAPVKDKKVKDKKVEDATPLTDKKESVQTPLADTLDPKKESKVDFVLVPEKRLKNPPKDKKSKAEQDKKAHDKGHETPKQAAVNNAVKQDNHIISLRTTQAIDLAVFENYGELWIINGNDSSYAIPTLNSAKPKLFSSLIPVHIEGAAGYRMTLPDMKLLMKATGGGLVWDLIMGDKVKEGKPKAPVREITDAYALRNGKIIFPLQGVGQILDIIDPVTGQKLKVVTVEEASQFTGAYQSFVDFDLLRAPIGMAIRPKIDDLRVKKTDKGIEIYAQRGIALSQQKEAKAAQIYANESSVIPDKKQGQHGKKGHGTASHAKGLFRFHEWKKGDTEALYTNKNIIMSHVHDKSKAGKVEDLLTLGKMFLSHGRGAEALGYFEYARMELPRLLQSPEFVALRGAARALDWKNEDALIDLSQKGLKDIEEVNYWKSYVLADLGDWQQAAAVLPKNFSLLHNYPDRIANRLALVLAEVSLRDGKVKQAEELMAIPAHNSHGIGEEMKAQLDYLRGEAYRQKGNAAKTKKIWKGLTQGKDDLYRAKAGLALAILLRKDGDIDNKQTIDRLERLRYAWRGDGLEAQINYWLGDAYFGHKNYIKGLAIMRDAAAIAQDSVLAGRITEDMVRTFADLFLSDGLKDVSATDAVAVYENFSELTPAGDKGNKIVQSLAEHLVRADLLDRATKLLKHQVDHRLKDEDKVRVAVRLAAIELINKKPQKAVNALGKASKELKRLKKLKNKDKYIKEIELLRIRAYSQNKQYDKALKLLAKQERGKNQNRLRADIAWQAGYWDEAADALNSVILDENITMDSALSEMQVDLLLNRAIALSLDSDRIALANMREKYSGLIRASGYKVNQFEVITRPSRNAALADRETLMSAVSEVDLFKEFLDAYRENK